MEINEDKLKEWMVLMVESMDRCSDNLEKLMIQYIKSKEELEKKYSNNKEQKDEN